MKALAFASAGVTIYDVARSAGVSTATVSRALNGSVLVAEKTRARVVRTAEELGYEPNSAARSLVTRSTQTIGLLLPDITNPFFPELVKGVQLLAAERSYTLLLSQTGNDPDTEQRYLNLFRGKGIDGLLVVGLALGRSKLTKFAASGIPLVSLDREVDLPGIPLVHLDNRAGARRATEHLLALGHRSIVHIGGPLSLTVSQERLRGFLDALESTHLDPRPELVVESDFTESGGRNAAMALVAAGVPFTAVFAANDVMAIGAMVGLKEGGLSVPGEVSVVGFDDIHLAGYTTPALTTLRQPAYEMGRGAAQILIDAIAGNHLSEGERQVVFQGELICRGSTARPSVQP
jgi:LacI family transcriptional regulator